MGNISYKPLIEDMTWSYSRIGSYDDCPYRFFLKYIKKFSDSDKFYASYGSFMHKLLERFYKGEINKAEMLTIFLSEFKSEVKGIRPVGTIVENYIKQGCEYLKSFSPLPYKLIEVEKEVRFKIGDYNFVGFIDYLGEEDGKIYIVDNKSRASKPRSKRSKPTVNDKELDLMLRQLYLYAAAVKQEYGVFPEALCFNCFRNGVFIKEEFDIQKYEETIKWAIERIEEIKETDEFEPNPDFFSCFWICGVNDKCKYDIQSREEKNRR